jgi:hypothetical protein
LSASARTSATPSGVSLFDARPFFEKALAYGVQHGLINQDKLDAICTDAPKGMVQIARYFGNEFLRPDLEKAKDRMVNLVSLQLEHATGGDLHQAAVLLRDNSFLSRSKGGSDLLKALIAMPQNSHFGMNERAGFSDDQIPVLAKWTLKSLPDYRHELAKRSQVAQVTDAAIWLAEQFGLDEAALEDAGKDAEAVIRTALLMLALKRTEMPDWVGFEKQVTALRKKQNMGKSEPATLALKLVVPPGMPPAFQAVVNKLWRSILADGPKILDATLPVRQLFDQTPAFMGRYFWLEDSLAEVDHFEREISGVWQKLTGGHSDEGSLLTLFLCVAAGSPPKTLLTEKTAATLIRKIRKSGLQPDLAEAFIQTHAPQPLQEGYTALWQDFMEESQRTLQSDMDYALNDALALLRRECNVG